MGHLEAVIGPRAELEDAGLYVVGEKLDVDGARGFVDGWRLPEHPPIGVDCRLCHQRHFVVAVCAVTPNRGYSFYCPGPRSLSIDTLTTLVFPNRVRYRPSIKMDVSIADYQLN